jgi:hypothetical protein
MKTEYIPAKTIAEYAADFLSGLLFETKEAIIGIKLNAINIPKT